MTETEGVFEIVSSDLEVIFTFRPRLPITVDTWNIMPGRDELRLSGEGKTLTFPVSADEAQKLRSITVATLMEYDDLGVETAYEAQIQRSVPDFTN